MDRLTKAQMEFMNGYVPANIHDIYEYAVGGNIHIDPSKKGTFKAQATRMNMGVQEAASHILANKDDYSSTMVKKANFARNFAKQEGGVAQGNQGNAQMMQMIQTYAQMVAQQSGDDPNKVYQKLMGQLQQMKPEQQQAAMQQIVKQVQGASQQPAMQMGGDPSQMQQAPQQQQSGDAEQLIQQVQQALKQGAKPEQVIAELLQEQIDPQMIVQIFVQLGMPQQEVVQDVQAITQQMQQGTPQGQSMSDPNAQQQMAPQGQEQENPQEQQQEQGQEEPQNPTMQYGGSKENIYNESLQDFVNNRNRDVNGFRAESSLVPNTNFNNSLVNANQLGNPNYSGIAELSTLHNGPAQAIAGTLGAISGLAGSALGYSALFNNKKNADSYQNWFQTKENQSQNAKTPNFNKPSVTTNNSYGDLYAGKQNDTWNKYNPKTNWNTLPHNQYGGKPMVGVTDGFGMNQPDYGTTYNPMLDQPDHQDQGIIISDTSEKNGYAFPQYAPKSNTNSVNTNKKTIVNGQQIASNALFGFGALNNSLDYFNNKSKNKANQRYLASQLNTMNPNNVYNPLETNGDYTTNVQGGADHFQPNKHTYAQSYSTSSVSKYGGSYQIGGTYPINGNSYITSDNSNEINIPNDGFSSPTSGMLPNELTKYNRFMLETTKNRNNWNRLAPVRALNQAHIQNYIDNNPGATEEDYWADMKKRNSGSDVGIPGMEGKCSKPGGNCGAATSLQKSLNGKQLGGQQNFQSGGQYKVSHDELVQLLRNGAQVEFL